MARAPSAERATSPRPSACPPARISPMTFISTRSNGSPTQSACMSIPLFTLHLTRRNGPPAALGFSITRSSSSSTLPWAEIGPARPTAPPFSRSKCSSTTSASTASNSRVTHLLRDEDFVFAFFFYVLGVSAFKLFVATLERGGKHRCPQHPIPRGNLFATPAPPPPPVPANLSLALQPPSPSSTTDTRCPRPHKSPRTSCVCATTG